jgi:hypothetical protein
MNYGEESTDNFFEGARKKERERPKRHRYIDNIKIER